MTETLTSPDRFRADPASTAGRRHGLDALRATALLLGILIHGLMPFVPDVGWLVPDRFGSVAATVVVSVIHLFRMALFMLLAGYFGRMVVQRRGSGRYLRDRALRIGLPVIIFWPLAVLPLGLIAAAAGSIDLDAPPPVTPGVWEPLLWFAPAQLWFLVVLLQCVLITIAVRFVLLRVLGPQRCGRIADRIGSMLATPFGVLLAVVPYLVGLLLQGPHAQYGIIAPTTILPAPGPLTAYLGAFLTGWFLHSRPDALARLAGRWPALLIIAVVLSAVTVADLDQLPAVVEATVTALAGWTWVFGLLGLSTRLLRRERPAVRYLADASYWMYLMHLPLLLLIEFQLRDLDWPILIKLLVACAVVSAALLISYDLLVRPTPIGRWLNGHRRRSALLGVVRRSSGHDHQPMKSRQ